MSDLIYRDARPEDVPTILILCHAGDARGADTPPLDQETLTDPRYRAAFDEISLDPNHRLIVVERDNEIVGTLQISFLPGLPRFGMRRAILENVHIRADQRGNGLGSQMVQWAVDRCREARCGIVQLTSNKIRLDAHRFYRKLGFEQTHEGFKLLL
jgi:GNAT superfamily N-acetyltransferase